MEKLIAKSGLPVFIICAVTLAACLVMLAVYIVKISRLKKEYPQGMPVPEVSSFLFYAVGSGIVLPVLPVFIPLDVYVVVIICACALMGIYMAFSERVKQLSFEDPKED